VKEGDSLWKIASEQLGNGSRYKEILKLNADILEDENSLSPGATLKLPTK
ncbi:MAG: LysM peptidoglycan-binding domain-containing protein, partial [Sedimentisphaerales bacterium]|nr:LysM peptidoglycan-binding domain-containing protein [Sedimentisphaerales bacterium]